MYAVPNTFSLFTHTHIRQMHTKNVNRQLKRSTNTDRMPTDL